jgi:hypothetical protein
MENNDIARILSEQQKKIDAISISVEKTRKYFLWTLLLTLAFFFFPLIGLLFVLPTFVQNITTGYGL